MTGRALHFVGFSEGEQRYQNAARVFGLPDFIHPGWDVRGQREIAPGDVVIFAEGGHDQAPRVKSFTDPNQ